MKYQYYNPDEIVINEDIEPLITTYSNRRQEELKSWPRNYRTNVAAVSFWPNKKDSPLVKYYDSAVSNKDLKDKFLLTRGHSEKIMMANLLNRLSYTPHFFNRPNEHGAYLPAHLFNEKQSNSPMRSDKDLPLTDRINNIVNYASQLKKLFQDRGSRFDVFSDRIACDAEHGHCRGFLDNITPEPNEKEKNFSGNFYYILPSDRNNDLVLYPNKNLNKKYRDELDQTKSNNPSVYSSAYNAYFIEQEYNALLDQLNQYTTLNKSAIKNQQQPVIQKDDDDQDFQAMVDAIDAAIATESIVNKSQYPMFVREMVLKDAVDGKAHINNQDELKEYVSKNKDRFQRPQKRMGGRIKFSHKKRSKSLSDCMSKKK